MRLLRLLVTFAAALASLGAPAFSETPGAEDGVLRGRSDVGARTVSGQFPAAWSLQATAGSAATTLARVSGQVVPSPTPGVTVRRLTRVALQASGQQGSNLTATRSGLAWLCRIAVQVDEPGHLFSPLAGGRWDAFSITVDATGLTEFFSLSVPQIPPGQSTPLVVAFHGAGTTYLDILNGTSLRDEAEARGWFFMTPLQVSSDLVGTGLDVTTHYSSVKSQLHVEAVMDLILRAYEVDLDRIYGIGFSMGGGAALNYAARHRDRSEGAFAAVVNHTGTVALSHVYSSASAARKNMEVLFGGAPGSSAEATFEYQRSSLIEMTGLKAAAALDPSGQHMAVNLGAVPVETWYATGDPLLYLQRESKELHAFLSSLPGATNVPLRTPSLSDHSWQTLDEAQAYAFLAPVRLQIAPISGSVLADRTARWGVYDVVQSAPGRFSSFDFHVQSGPVDSLELTSVENVESVAVDVDDLGFDGATPCTFTVESLSPAASILEISGLAWGPSSRVSHSALGAINSQRCPATGSTSWCFSNGTLTLHDTTPGWSTWTITP